MRKRDDSNKFVVSVTAFNQASRDPLVVATLLAVLVIIGLWLYDLTRKAAA